MQCIYKRSVLKGCIQKKVYSAEPLVLSVYYNICWDSFTFLFKDLTTSMYILFVLKPVSLDACLTLFESLTPSYWQHVSYLCNQC